MLRTEGGKRLLRYGGSAVYRGNYSCQRKQRICNWIDLKTNHFNAHKHVYRPDVKACTFRVSRYDSHIKAVAKAEHMKGVMNTKWNPRTRELTVIYDAKVTSARHIMHLVA